MSDGACQMPDVEYRMADGSYLATSPVQHRGPSISCRASAAVIFEMVLAMPLLILILFLLFYFGRGMVRVQRAQVADRYQAWFEVGRAPGPGGGGVPGQLNQMFFANNAESLVIDQADQFPADGMEQLVEDVAGVDSDAALLAERLGASLPSGRLVRLEAVHGETVPVWRQFEGPIRHAHIRIEHEWRFVNGWRRESQLESQPWPSHGGWYPGGALASLLSPLRRTFFSEFDDGLAELDPDGPAGDMVRMIEGLYAQEPSYAGPSVPP